jgi:hypothetical protein
MMFADVTNFYRKSGVAQWRDLCVDAPSWKCFSTDRSVAQLRDLPFFQSHIRSNSQNFNIPWYHNSHSQPTHFVTVANTYKCWRVRA